MTLEHFLKAGLVIMGLSAIFFIITTIMNYSTKKEEEDVNKVVRSVVNIMNQKTNYKLSMADREARRAYLKEVSLAAVRVANVDENMLPSVWVAQAIIETGWGQKFAAPFNCLGIKARKGEDHQVTKTHEYRNGIKRVEDAAFRTFTSFEGCFSVAAEKIKKQPHYATIRANKKTVVGCTLGLKLWATAPDYPERLQQLIMEYKLYRLDAISEL